MAGIVFILIGVALTNLVLAIFVVLYKPRAEVNRVFALTALAVAGWTFTNALFQDTTSISIATQAAAFSYLSAITLGASFLHFAWIFPRRSFVSQQQASFSKVVLWLIALLVGSMAFIPGFVIQSVIISGNRSITTNSGIYAIAVFMLITSIWAFGRLAYQHAQLRDIERAQSRYVLTGSALTATIGLICNLLLPLLHNYAWVWLGPTSSLCFVSFIVYAIIAQHLFDIRIIIKRTLVYSLLLAGLAAGYSAVEYLFTEGLQHVTATGNQHPLLANVGGAVVVSFFVAPVRHWLEKRLDALIFGHQRKQHPKHRHTVQQPGA